jgi:hypothetical protein
LQEAAGVLQKPALEEISKQLTAAGDVWRGFALNAAKICKDRMPMDLNLLSDQLMQCADLEEGVYRRLRTELN